MEANDAPQSDECPVWRDFLDNVYRPRRKDRGLAVKHRIASVGTWDFAKAGGLIGYGVNSLDNYRHIAVFVDKIFKGAKPADIPVEQPTKLELVINLKTANALGLTIPQSLLLRADDLIE